MKPIVSTNSKIRHPESFVIGDFSTVDDFSYFSTKVTIGIHCHIASGCSVAGGREFQFSLGDFSSISSGVKIWCRSNDYVNDLVILNPEKKDLNDNSIKGDVSIGRYCGVGSNSVIMPNNTIPEGTVIGALSFVPTKFSFQAWSVYAGTPIRLIKKRNKESILKQLALLI